MNKKKLVKSTKKASKKIQGNVVKPKKDTIHKNNKTIIVLQMTSDRIQQLQHQIQMVQFIKKSKNKKQSDLVFDKLVSLLNNKIMNLLRSLNIPGSNNNDLYQQALYALRYKAIKDYDHQRSAYHNISAFDNFALLCIKRHLSTKIKSAWQGKSAVLNGALSLDQDRTKNGGDGNEQSAGLNDIITQKQTTVLNQFQQKTNYAFLQRQLVSQMSDFQLKVFLLYKRNMSYQQMVKVIYKKSKNSKILSKQLKSIDNSISRIKAKGKLIGQKYFKDNKNQK